MVPPDSFPLGPVAEDPEEARDPGARTLPTRVPGPVWGPCPLCGDVAGRRSVGGHTADGTLCSLGSGPERPPRAGTVGWSMGTRLAPGPGFRGGRRPPAQPRREAAAEGAHGHVRPARWVSALHVWPWSAWSEGVCVRAGLWGAGRRSVSAGVHVRPAPVAPRSSGRDVGPVSLRKQKPQDCRPSAPATAPGFGVGSAGRGEGRGPQSRDLSVWGKTGARPEPRWEPRSEKVPELRPPSRRQPRSPSL